MKEWYPKKEESYLSKIRCWKTEHGITTASLKDNSQQIDICSSGIQVLQK